jgi:hypothetical protein
MWSSVKHFTASKLSLKVSFIDTSEYCFISKPLHFKAPSFEKVPNKKFPFADTALLTISTYLEILVSSVKK